MFQISFKNRSLKLGLHRLMLMDAMNDSEGIKSGAGKLKFSPVWNVIFSATASRQGQSSGDAKGRSMLPPGKIASQASIGRAVREVFP
jgi:hypothetical protein